MAIYFDNNSTTRLDPRVFEAMQPYLQGPYGNPSSLHRYGRAARDAVEAARAQVAVLAGAQAAEVIWTSGGTEADNFAVKGAAASAAKPTRMLYGATEHAAVLESAQSLRGQGWAVDAIVMRQDGLIDADDFVALNADLLSLSAHKLHGPRGIGALIKRAEIELTPLHHGGGQEQGLRGGTENVAAIVGFGVAAELAVQERETRAAQMLTLRRRFEAGLHALPGAHIFAKATPRLPNTVQFALPGYAGEALLMALDRKGIAVSSGSACHSGSGEPSHVLLGMGIARDVAFGAIRVSFSAENTEAEVDRVLAVLTVLHAEAMTV